MNERLSNEHFVPGKADTSTIDRPTVTAVPIADEYERLEVADHPFFVELRARPVDLQAIWILMANLRAGISRDFVIWLAETIARVDDRRVASLLAKQLNDELGNGDFAQIHSVLLDRFVAGLDRWRPHGVADALLGPGKRLAEEGTNLFRTRDTNEAMGALIVGEIFAKKMDCCLGDEIRRQSAIPDEALTWLTLHEVLEADHADDSRVLAELVPKAEAAVAGARRGASLQWQSLWTFLDGVQSLAVQHGSARSVS